MSNQYTIYQSTDSGAPAFNGDSLGSLITVLDACLVNGYGSKAAAGWTKPFSGTNLAVYRAPGGVQHYFRIDDSNPGGYGSTGNKNARFLGYETMSDVNTGTHPFPTVAQATNGLPIAKNPAADTLWTVAADTRTVMFFGDADGTPTYKGAYFGEFFSFVTNDSYRSLIRGGVGENPVTLALDLLSTSIVTPTSAAYIARGHTGVGSAVNVSITGDNDKANGSTALLGAIPFPNPSDGGMYMCPLWISDPTTSPANGIRGRMRGLWQFLHPIAGVNNFDTVTGTGDLSGKTFLILKRGSNNGLFLIETSATLETN